MKAKAKQTLSRMKAGRGVFTFSFIFSFFFIKDIKKQTQYNWSLGEGPATGALQCYFF